METFLVVTSTILIAVFIADTSQKRRARLCQQVEVAQRQPTITE